MASTKATINSKCQSSFRSVGVGTGTEDEETYSEMGGSQRWEERKDHPLLNDVILNTLFEFMSGNELKKCRLVCQKWCVSTLPFARSKFSFTLHGNGNSEKITKRLTDFVEVFRQNKLGLPFNKYILASFCTTEGPGEEFLQICGSTAKVLSLIKQYADDLSTVEVEDISEILKAMPNIESFGLSRIRSRSGNVVKLFSDDSDSPTKPALTFLTNIIFYDWDPEKIIDFCPTFIEEILSIAPNVSVFRLRDSRVDPNRSRIGQVLKAIEKFKRESIVTSLQFFNVNNDHFEPIRRLAENGLKLNNFDFVRSFEGETQESSTNNFLPQLANFFKNSIGRLSVDEVCSSLIQLPHMPKLEKLAIQISEDFDSKRVDLNKLCPSLKKLGLYNWEADKGWAWDEFLPNSEPCPNLKAFCLTKVAVKIKLFDHILKIFPKLTTLALEVKTDGAQIVRKIMIEMTQLESLTVGGTIEGIESIDALLTGISVQKVKELEHVVLEFNEMTVPLRTETIRHYLTRYCHFPSITNLTNLKYLDLSCTGRLDGNPTTRYTQMTDVFAYLALYSMKHVNELGIHNSLFTKSGAEILTVEMGLESWTVKDNVGGDVIPQVQPVVTHFGGMGY